MFVFIIKKKKKQKNNCLQHFLMLFCAFWALCVHMIYMIIPNSRSNAITDGMQKDFLWFSSSARETFFFGSKRFRRVLAACRFARVCLTWMARCSFFSRISIFWVCPGSHLNHISWKKDKKSKKADILADFAWLIEVINSDDTLRSRAWRSEPRQGPGSRSDFIGFGIAEGEINSEFWKHEQTADRSRRIVKKRYNKSECFRS